MKKHTALHAFRRKVQKGMTLVEVIVVIAIIAIITSLVAIAVVPQLGSAQVDAAKIEINNIMNALDLYYLKHKSYPNAAGGLQALVAEEFLKKPPKDPWKNDYVYILEGGKPVVISYGADGAPGGEGKNADISSKNL
jgi:general secretion pathway protein G